MLLRERVPIMLLFLYVILSFIDILTPKGNEFWEKYIGFPGRYSIMQGEKVGYVNGRCRLLVRPMFEQGAPYFKEGLSPVMVGTKWGYIDTTGRMVIPAAFRFASEFSENRAYVSYKSSYRSGNLKFGYIDAKGNSVIPGIYARAQNFSEGVAGVMDGGVWGFIRYDGAWLNSQRFEDVQEQFSSAAVEIALGKNFIATFQQTHHEGTYCRHPRRSKKSCRPKIEPMTFQAGNFICHCIYGWIAITAIRMPWLAP